MGKMVKIEIPITEEAAAVLRDPASIEYAGRLLSSMIVPSKPNIQDFRQALAELHVEVKASGLTDEMVDEELAAYNAERRI